MIRPKIKCQISKILIVLLLGWGVVGVGALDPVEELQQQIDELSHLRQLSEAATKPLEEELENIQEKIIMRVIS